jgi:hypothetical protein
MLGRFIKAVKFAVDSLEDVLDRSSEGCTLYGFIIDPLALNRSLRGPVKGIDRKGLSFFIGRRLHIAEVKGIGHGIDMLFLNVCYADKQPFAKCN